MRVARKINVTHRTEERTKYYRMVRMKRISSPLGHQTSFGEEVTLNCKGLLLLGPNARRISTRHSPHPEAEEP